MFCIPALLAAIARIRTVIGYVVAMITASDFTAQYMVTLSPVSPRMLKVHTYSSSAQNFSPTPPSTAVCSLALATLHHSVVCCGRKYKRFASVGPSYSVVCPAGLQSPELYNAKIDWINSFGFQMGQRKFMYRVVI